MVFVLVLFKSRKKAVNVHSSGLEVLLIAAFFTGSVILSLNAVRYLPILDFRPYDVGTYMPEEMVVPEGAPRDEYKTVCCIIKILKRAILKSSRLIIIHKIR